jgi:ADP-ribose pyrophosphatase
MTLRPPTPPSAAPTPGPAPQDTPPWNAQGERVLVESPILTLKMRRSSSSLEPDRSGDFVVVDTPDWVNVIALTADQRIVLVQQYRHGSDAVTLEIPGGMVDAGEDFLTAGLRELAEETGFVGEDAAIIGVVAPNPAFMSNRCATVLVRGVKAAGTTELDEHEEIAVWTPPLADIPDMIRSGRITHALVLAAFHHLHLLQTAPRA